MEPFATRTVYDAAAAGFDLPPLRFWSVFGQRLVDHARLRPGEFADIRRATGRRDPAVADRDRLDDRLPRIDRDDLAVDEHGVGGLCRYRHRKGDNDERSEQKRS